MFLSVVYVALFSGVTVLSGAGTLFPDMEASGAWALFSVAAILDDRTLSEAVDGSGASSVVL